MLMRSNVKRGKKKDLSMLPDFIAESVQTIDFKALRKLGITTCLVDLDGTVVNTGTFEVHHKTIKVLKKSGLAIYIATNRPRSRDLKTLKDDLGAKGVIHPHLVFGKPLKTYYRRALHQLGLKPHAVVMIGDRYVQDILGANRAGIYSLLVHKLGPSKNRVDRLISNAEGRFTRLITKKIYKA